MHQSRAKISDAAVSLLFSSDTAEVCSCDLATAVELSESTVSHHLTQLRKARPGRIRTSRNERLPPSTPRIAYRALHGAGPQLLPLGCGRARSQCGQIACELIKRGGAKGNRTPDLLDANETRYQLRYSPLVSGRLPAGARLAETGDLLPGRPRQVEVTGERNLIEVLEDRVLVVDVQHRGTGPAQP